MSSTPPLAAPSVFQHRAEQMVHRAARWYQAQGAALLDSIVIHDLVTLITDCATYAAAPALAVELVLTFHPHVEGWACLAPWCAALDAALAVVTDAGDRQLLLLHRSQAAREVGDGERAEMLAHAVLRDAEAAGDERLMAHALNKLGRIAFRRHDYPAARAAWSAGERRATAAGATSEHAALALNLGWLAKECGEWDTAERWLAAAEQDARAIGSEPELIKVHANQALVKSDRGHYAAAAVLLRALTPRFVAQRDWAGAAMNHNGLGYIALLMADYATAAAELGQARALFDQLGIVAGQALVRSNLGELYVRQASWERATAALQEAQQIAKAARLPLLVAAIQVDQGTVAAAQGNHAAAQALWAAALAVQEASGSPAAAATKVLLHGPTA